jgi:hypothetical protein
VLGVAVAVLVVATPAAAIVPTVGALGPALAALVLAKSVDESDIYPPGFHSHCVRCTRRMSPMPKISLGAAAKTVNGSFS